MVEISSLREGNPQARASRMSERPTLLKCEKPSLSGVGNYGAFSQDSQMVTTDGAKVCTATGNSCVCQIKCLGGTGNREWEAGPVLVSNNQ
jgi:hypothetical protein